MNDNSEKSNNDKCHISKFFKIDKDKENYNYLFAIFGSIALISSIFLFIISFYKIKKIKNPD